MRLLSQINDADPGLNYKLASSPGEASVAVRHTAHTQSVAIGASIRRLGSCRRMAQRPALTSSEVLVESATRVARRDNTAAWVTAYPTRTAFPVSTDQHVNSRIGGGLIPCSLTQSHSLPRLSAPSSLRHAAITNAPRRSRPASRRTECTRQSDSNRKAIRQSERTVDRHEHEVHMPTACIAGGLTSESFQDPET